MLFNGVGAHAGGSARAEGLGQDRLLRVPGAYLPLVAMLIEELAFDGVYVSGAVIANDLGLPDVGLTTLSEVSHRARAISRVTALPAIVDVHTGFGEPMNVARTVQELDELGLAGCHLEDQICATPTTRRSTKASTTSGARGTIAANETINVVKASRATRVRRRPQPRTGPR
jgi:methylisocitrate lyase